MTVLYSGKCEPLKACVHGVMLGTVALCAAYNLAAWLTRRQGHLAVNAVLYSAAMIWEYQHVVHHLAACPNLPREPKEKAQAITNAA